MASYHKEQSYTEHMREAFGSRVSGLESLYCREDIESALRRFKRADASSRKFREKELRQMCVSRGLDIRGVIKGTESLGSVPCREDMKSALMEILHDLCAQAPSPADYMERIVRRLAPEYNGDTVRTAILKKFIAGAGFGNDSVKTEEILSAVRKKLSPAEKKEYDRADDNGKIALLCGKINDGIFSEWGGERDVGADILGLMKKELIKLDKKYALTGKDGESRGTDSLSVSASARKALLPFFEEMGITFPEGGRIKDILEAMPEGDAMPEAVDILEKELRRQLGTVFYKNRNGVMTKASAMYEDDRKKYKSARAAQPALIGLCSALAEGRFRTNSGATRVNLYYFAIMFGMTAALRDGDVFDPERDMEKNLFSDYYCDNLIRYYGSDCSGDEAEPAGSGINFKNFTEVIYLYYLYRNDLGLSAGERIDRAEKKIKECIERADGDNSEKACENSELYTSLYRKSYIGEALCLDEDSLTEHILSNYVINRKGTAKIMLASEQNTACDIMAGLMEDLEDMYGSPEEDESSFGSFIMNSGLSAALRERYADDKDFIRIIDKTDKRISEEFSYIDRRMNMLLPRVLFILYHGKKGLTRAAKMSDGDDRLKLMTYSDIRERLKKEHGMTVYADTVDRAADILAKAGFDVRSVQVKCGSGKRNGTAFLLGKRNYGDPELDCIIAKTAAADYYIGYAVEPLMEALAEKTQTGGRKVTRSMIITAAAECYIAECEGVTSFPEIYSGFAASVNGKLAAARFGPVSEKNIFDMYMIISIYWYAVVNGIG